MDEELTEEQKLVEQAKLSILKRLIEVAGKATSGTGVLNLAEAYMVLHREQLSGRINVPPKG